MREKNIKRSLEFLELYKKGLTLQQVGDQLGFTKQHVSFLLNRDFYSEMREYTSNPISRPHKLLSHTRKKYIHWKQKNEKTPKEKAIQRYKHLAREMVHVATRFGMLVRPKNCSKCTLETKIHAHHEDYSRPLEIIWLCAKCHKKLHVEKLQVLKLN